MAFWQWSKTPATNATADPTVNWAEGQSPSSVNDSSRAGMSRLAEWRDDVSGTITTGGSSTAYTVTSNQVFDSLAHMNGAMIAFIVHATNGATVTLAVDGLTAKPLRFAPSVELPSGVLVLGTPYVATYVNADNAFYLHGLAVNPYVVPIGSMVIHTGSTAPNSSFVIPIGQAISRTTYSTYFGIVSTTYGTGDGATTFNVPDLRGRAVFQPDSGGSARITVAGGNFDGTVLGGTGGAQNHTLTTAEMPVHTHSVTDPQHNHSIPAVSGTVGLNGATTAITAWKDGSGLSTGSAATGISIQNAGSGSAHTIMPPTILLPYILRVI